MKRESDKFLMLTRHNSEIRASFNHVTRLTVLDIEAIRLELLDEVSKKGVTLEIDLSNIEFVDSAVIDVFNLLSRLALRYQSLVKLVHVTEELMELITLVRHHAVFDIRYINNLYLSRSVA